MATLHYGSSPFSVIAELWPGQCWPAVPRCLASPAVGHVTSCSAVVKDRLPLSPGWALGEQVSTSTLSFSAAEGLSRNDQSNFGRPM